MFDNQNKIHKQFSKYINNKRIVIVGPSPSIFNNKEGELINNFDIIIRIKKSIPIPDNLKEYIGNRTDILCTHLKLKQNNFDDKSLKLLSNELKFIYMPFPLISPFNSFYESFISYYKFFLQKFKIKKIPVYYIDPNNINEFNNYKNQSKLLDTTPTTFAALLIDILRYNFKELYITGITFGQDGYYKQYKTKEEAKESFERTITKRKIHNLDKEILYFKDILLNDTRITLSDDLINIFNNF
jgi:hypothetical protein